VRITLDGEEQFAASVDVHALQAARDQLGTAPAPAAPPPPARAARGLAPCPRPASAA
jgi:hypothetical protein